MIGCVSPIHSAIEYTMDMLHLCAMAKGAKYVKDFSSRLSAYQDHESIRSGATLNVETHASILSSLQKTIQQADQAAKNARAGSVSLDAAADKWRSHRRKLSRASTVCVKHG